ncbi:uncharacterized protein V1516DRAFT_665066 [Lipomyces oligophaga]|uniref:uncharacterized protein n=1 Tax=Lipomyces oligophaga TaxID=45792 RepID=UPI0034CF2A45
MEDEMIFRMDEDMPDFIPRSSENPNKQADRVVKLRKIGKVYNHVGMTEGKLDDSLGSTVSGRKLRRSPRQTISQFAMDMILYKLPNPQIEVEVFASDPNMLASVPSSDVGVTSPCDDIGPNPGDLLAQFSAYSIEMSAPQFPLAKGELSKLTEYKFRGEYPTYDSMNLNSHLSYVCDYSGCATMAAVDFTKYMLYVIHMSEERKKSSEYKDCLANNIQRNDTSNSTTTDYLRAKSVHADLHARALDASVSVMRFPGLRITFEPIELIVFAELQAIAGDLIILVKELELEYKSWFDQTNESVAASGRSAKDSPAYREILSKRLKVQWELFNLSYMKLLVIFGGVVHDIVPTSLFSMYLRISTSFTKVFAIKVVDITYYHLLDTGFYYTIVYMNLIPVIPQNVYFVKSAKISDNNDTDFGIILISETDSDSVVTVK